MILRWVRDKICHYGGSALENLDIDPYDLMTMKAEHVDAGADGLICLPYFTGERAPYWNFVITRGETQNNPVIATQNNPDPSGLIEPWNG